MDAPTLLNLALLKIGVSQTITTIADATREAYTGALVFDHHLRATLRSFPWAFATKYQALTLTQGPAWDDTAPVQAWSASQTYAIGDVVDLSGTFYYATAASLNFTPPNASYWTTTATDEANGDWLYAYRWPSDCLFVRRVVPASGRRVYSGTPLQFRIGRDANGLLIYTNEQDAVIEYTVIDCDALWADDHFIDAFTWRLAAVLAPTLSRDSKMAATCYQMYLLALEHATVVGSREQQQAPPGNAEWTDAR